MSLGYLPLKTDIAMEYPMQAVTLVVVMAITFAAVVVWAKYKKTEKKVKRRHVLCRSATN